MSQLFDAALEGFLDSSVNWSTATHKVAAVRGYTFDAADRTVADVVAGGATLVKTSAALAGKTVTGGAANADDTVLPAVPSGAAITGLLVFQSSAAGGGADVAQGSQRVIAYIDQTSDGSLPVTPNGGDIDITWSNAPADIFHL